MFCLSPTRPRHVGPNDHFPHRIRAHRCLHCTHCFPYHQRKPWNSRPQSFHLFACTVHGSPQERQLAWAEEQVGCYLGGSFPTLEVNENNKGRTIRKVIGGWGGWGGVGKKTKKKFMQKEGPIVTFSHVVKKIRAEGFTWKKNSCTSSERKKNSCKLKIPHPSPPPITFLVVRP